MSDPSLPGYYAITGTLEADGTQRPIFQQDAGCEWLERFERLLASDVALIQLRVKQLELDHLDKVIRTSYALAAKRGVRLTLNGSPEVASCLGLDGVHLTTSKLMELRRRPLSGDHLVGASCHSPRELEHAEQIGCDFACLSPVKPTKFYESEDCLGFERFAEWVSSCSIPVYGLGGLTREDFEAIQEAGGQGVAGISAFW